MTDTARVCSSRPPHPSTHAAGSPIEPDRGPGPHRGGGEAEQALIAAVQRALAATGYPALRQVEIEVARGVIVLWGQVPTYYHKQMAQVTAQQVAGVRGIANGLEVICCRVEDRSSAERG